MNRTSTLQRHALRPVAACVIAMAVLCAMPAVAAKSAASQSVAWQFVSTDAEVDRAFAESRKSGKPVFLYWGAVWCPPCNQVKATLFSRADFIERSRAFVPVYVDGDKPGAQKVASRFKVQGYPTMIIFKPDGTEITRLPGEVDPQRYLLTLTAGLNAQVPVKDLVQKALAKQALTPEQWRLLAYYSWDTDEQQVLTSEELPRKLGELAAVAPAELAEVRNRLALKSLAARASSSGKDAAADPAAAAEGLRLVEKILADANASRGVSDVLVNYSEKIVKFVAPAGDARKALATRWEAAMAPWAEDAGMSKVDQIDLLYSRVALWKLADGSDTLSAQRQPVVLRSIAKLVAATPDKYERQAVVPNAAYVLAHAGLIKESDELLKQELPRAVAPYYHMLGLASNAKRRNDPVDALKWYEQAWKKSEGPATRIQWGSGFINQLVDLAPNDSTRIETAATTLVKQLEPKGETFYERNHRSLKRMASRLAKWQGTDPQRAKVVEKVKAQLATTCSRLPAKDAGRANCESVFTASNA